MGIAFSHVSLLKAQALKLKADSAPKRSRGCHQVEDNTVAFPLHITLDPCSPVASEWVYGVSFW